MGESNESMGLGEFFAREVAKQEGETGGAFDGERREGEKKEEKGKGEKTDLEGKGKKKAPAKRAKKEGKKGRKESDQDDDFDDLEEEEWDDLDEEDDDEGGDEEETDEEDEDEAEEEDGDEEEDEDGDDEDDVNPILVQLQQQNAMLLKTIQDMNKKPTKKEDPAVDPFATDAYEDLVEAFGWDSKEQKLFKNFLTLYQKETSKGLSDRVLQDTSEIVTKSITQQQTLQQTKEAFFDNHPALKGVRAYVAQVAQEIATEMGDTATIPQVLDLAAKRAYETLGIKRVKPKKGKKGKAKEEGTKKKKKKPAFGKKKGARKGRKTKSKLASELDAMLDIM